MWWDMKREKKKVRQKASSNPDRSFQKDYSTRSKSLSRKVCSLRRHICNASGQLKQDQVLSKWKGESWNLKNSPLNSQLHYIFQISNKIWNELPHECCFLCSNSAKKCIFTLFYTFFTQQDQVLSKWKGESWNLKNSPLNSQLHYIFQISNKIWNELPHECCFLCSNSAKKCIFLG